MDRQRDHLPEEISEPDHRTAVPAGLEILTTQTDARRREALRTLWVPRLATLDGREHQPK